MLQFVEIIEVKSSDDNNSMRQFESNNDTCLCVMKLSSDKSSCAQSCTDHKEIERNNICIPTPVKKSSDANGCITGTSTKTQDCNCDNEQGYYGFGGNTACVDCLKKMG
ncbi:Hypothetical_protein [Hexamita inflata]|uniref:Hypothetical_protein n=1 Tax=Hexamita inflata TaxID=28002 RepID=A0AA86PS00_9EUKA|nr:Hypothetical protein HINF_LOCUS28090 [Hexamita inflata]